MSEINKKDDIFMTCIKEKYQISQDVDVKALELIEMLYLKSNFEALGEDAKTSIGRFKDYRKSDISAILHRALYFLDSVH